MWNTKVPAITFVCHDYPKSLIRHWERERKYEVRWEKAQKLIAAYEKHKNSGLYKAVMDIIVRANKETFEEVKGMCKALEELMKDELDACREKGLAEGRAAGREAGLAEGRAAGRVDGMRALIETCHEIGLTQEETLRKLEEKFELEQAVAEEYLMRFWKYEAVIHK